MSRHASLSPYSISPLTAILRHPQLLKGNIIFFPFDTFKLFTQFSVALRKSEEVQVSQISHVPLCDALTAVDRWSQSVLKQVHDQLEFVEIASRGLQEEESKVLNLGRPALEENMLFL